MKREYTITKKCEVQLADFLIDEHDVNLLIDLCNKIVELTGDEKVAACALWIKEIVDDLPEIGKAIV